MNIETVEDLASTIADWIGIYNGCKNLHPDDDNCTYDKNKPFCCRQGFLQAMEERIKEAVDNDAKLLLAQLKK